MSGKKHCFESFYQQAPIIGNSTDDPADQSGRRLTLDPEYNRVRGAAGKCLDTVLPLYADFSRCKSTCPDTSRQSHVHRDVIGYSAILWELVCFSFHLV